jgi:hypothetical protein
LLLALEGALVNGVVCLSPAATENVNLFVFLHTMIQIFGENFPEDTIECTSRPAVPIGIQKTRKLSNGFIQFSKEFEAVVVLPLGNKTFKGVVDRSNYDGADLMKSTVQQFILHLDGTHKCPPALFLLFYFSLALSLLFTIQVIYRILVGL